MWLYRNMCLRTCRDTGGTERNLQKKRGKKQMKKLERCPKCGGEMRMMHPIANKYYIECKTCVYERMLTISDRVTRVDYEYPVEVANKAMQEDREAWSEA